MRRHQISDKEYMTALALGQAEATSEVRAESIRYVSDRDVIEIVTTRGSGFLIPLRWIDALRDVPTGDLVNLTIWPDGSAIELENRDIQISVHGLITAMLPAMLPASAVAAMFASR